MCFDIGSSDPSTLGARAKTRLESRMKCLRQIVFAGGVGFPMLTHVRLCAAGGVGFPMPQGFPSPMGQQPAFASAAFPNQQQQGG